eukprot:Sspe_Gene.34333::Locus_16704_Transcript_1_1_Confidence_1.000_Length_1613::g.34333::m.34333
MAALIDLYKSLQSFKIKEHTLPKEAVIIPAKQRVLTPLGVRALPVPKKPVPFDVFLERFHDFTCNAFRYVTWDNIVVAGGTLTYSLMEDADETEYADSDVDVFVFGLGPSEVQQKLRLMRAEIAKGWGVNEHEVLSVRTPMTYTFAGGWPRRTVQVITGEWQNIETVLRSTDVDCTGVGFDGTHVWCTNRARLALKNRWNVIHDFGKAVRDDYPKRLAKYARRGFAAVNLHAPWKTTRNWDVLARVPTLRPDDLVDTGNPGEQVVLLEPTKVSGSDKTAKGTGAHALWRDRSVLRLNSEAAKVCAAMTGRCGLEPRIELRVYGVLSYRGDVMRWGTSLAARAHALPEAVTSSILCFLEGTPQSTLVPYGEGWTVEAIRDHVVRHAQDRADRSEGGNTESLRFFVLSDDLSEVEVDHQCWTRRLEPVYNSFICHVSTASHTSQAIRAAESDYIFSLQAQRNVTNKKLWLY